MSYIFKIGIIHSGSGTGSQKRKIANPDPDHKHWRTPPEEGVTNPVILFFTCS